MLDRLVAQGWPIAEVLTFDLRQSMRNGGGPACLRLRVALTDVERAAIRASVFLDDGARATRSTRGSAGTTATACVPGDLGDPALLDESRRALDELTTARFRYRQRLSVPA